MYRAYTLSYEKIKFNVQILRNINKQTTYWLNLESVSTRHDEVYTQYNFVFYFNLQLLQVFDSLNPPEYVIQLLPYLDLLQMKNMTPKRKHI